MTGMVQLGAASYRFNFFKLLLLLSSLLSLQDVPQKITF